MPELPVNTLMDGLILAGNVLDASGSVIIPAGAVVNHSVRNRLLHAKVARVAVTEESYGLFSLVAPAAQPPRAAPASGTAVKSASVSNTASFSAPAAEEANDSAPKRSDTVTMQSQLMRLARMFAPYREDPLMRELLRLAIKCAQERLISV